MTATAGSVFTAADFNTYIRDNLNETAVAKASTAGRIFVATGENSLAERAVGSDSLNSIDSITSTSYGAAPVNAGPEVTVTTGTAALVHWSARMSNDTAGQLTYMSVAIGGATTLSADDQWSQSYESSNANDIIRSGTSYMFTGLTAGSNTFTAQYRVTNSTGSGDVRHRHLWVMPL